MKKFSLFAILGLIVADAANAASYSETVTTVTPMSNGMMETSSTYTTTTQAKNMPDNSPVVLRGYIIKNVGDDMYLFQDMSDSIFLEMDGNAWNGLSITPNDMVIVHGDVDKGMNSTEIDVDYIEMAK